jgi:hypothetical protein
MKNYSILSNLDYFCEALNCEHVNSESLEEDYNEEYPSYIHYCDLIQEKSSNIRTVPCSCPHKELLLIKVAEYTIKNNKGFSIIFNNGNIVKCK